MPPAAWTTIINNIRDMTKDRFRSGLIELGIIDREGKLTEFYRQPVKNNKKRKTNTDSKV